MADQPAPQKADPSVAERFQKWLGDKARGVLQRKANPPQPSADSRSAQDRQSDLWKRQADYAAEAKRSKEQRASEQRDTSSRSSGRGGKSRE